MPGQDVLTRTVKERVPYCLETACALLNIAQPLNHLCLKNLCWLSRTVPIPHMKSGILNNVGFGVLFDATVCLSKLHLKWDAATHKMPHNVL